MSETGTQADPELAARLARAYIEASRRTSDPRLLGYAQGVLQPWWNQSNPPDDVRLLRATILQSRHRFDAALSDLDALLASRPQDAQAWLTRAAILGVQGRYAEALPSCAKLRNLASMLVAELCEIGIRASSGGLTEALARIESLTPSSAGMDRATRAWFDAVHADLLERAGRSEAARDVYLAALIRDPADHALRAAYADLLLDAKRPEEAITITQGYPQVDALLLRNTIARRRVGRPDARLEAVLAETFQAAQRRGEDLHLRDAARFSLEIGHDPSRALQQARKNWETQREPADARVLLEAAAAAGDEDEAGRLRAWLTRSGMQDRRLAAAGS